MTSLEKLKADIVAGEAALTDKKNYLALAEQRDVLAADVAKLLETKAQLEGEIAAVKAARKAVGDAEPALAVELAVALAVMRTASGPNELEKAQVMYLRATGWRMRLNNFFQRDGREIHVQAAMKEQIDDVLKPFKAKVLASLESRANEAVFGRAQPRPVAAAPQ